MQFFGLQQTRLLIATESCFRREIAHSGTDDDVTVCLCCFWTDYEQIITADVNCVLL